MISSKFIRIILVLSLGALGLLYSPNIASACSITSTDTTAVGTTPDGCFVGDVRYESIKVSQTSITKSGSDTASPYTLTISLSLNAPNKLFSFQVVAMHSHPSQNRYTLYLNENPYQGDVTCIGTTQYRSDADPSFFANPQLNNNRNYYAFTLSGQVQNGCSPGDLYFEIIPSLSTSTGSIILGKTLPGNKLIILPAPKVEGGYCESNDIDLQIPNPDGSIWFCQRQSLGSAAKWHVVTGSSATIVNNCAFKCTNETLYPSQVDPKLKRLKLSPLGSPCQKMNQTVSNGSSTEVCLKTGKKLLWASPKQDHASTLGNNASPQSFALIGCSDAKKIQNGGFVVTINAVQDMVTQFGMATRLSSAYLNLSQSATWIYNSFIQKQNVPTATLINAIGIINDYCGTNLRVG